MAWHEDNVRQRYALDAAPVQTLRHRFAVCHALEEATRTLDGEAASLARLRPDSAYRLWLLTGLPRLTVASALEVRGPSGERSRFGVGLPRRPDPPSSAPSPPRWSPHPPGCEVESGVEAVLETERQFPSGASVTLRVADRASEIPFLPRAAGIADHFLLRGDAAPCRVSRKGPPAQPPLRRYPPEPDEGRVELGVLVHGEPFVISWRRTGLADHAGALLGWGFLAALIALLVAVRRARPASSSRTGRPGPEKELPDAVDGSAGRGRPHRDSGRRRPSHSSVSECFSSPRATGKPFPRSFSVQRVAQELAALDPLIPGEELALRLAQAADQLDTDARALQRR